MYLRARRRTTPWPDHCDGCCRRNPQPSEGPIVQMATPDGQACRGGETSADLQVVPQKDSGRAQAGSGVLAHGAAARVVSTASWRLMPLVRGQTHTGVESVTTGGSDGVWTSGPGASLSAGALPLDTLHRIEVKRAFRVRFTCGWWSDDRSRRARFRRNRPTPGHGGRASWAASSVPVAPKPPTGGGLVRAQVEPSSPGVTRRVIMRQSLLVGSSVIPVH